jgi:hypothetical protein
MMNSNVVIASKLAVPVFPVWLEAWLASFVSIREAILFRVDLSKNP